MKPVEFVLWLNGAAELVGDQPPTPEQWATMREKLGEAVGGLVAARLLERAEETLRADEKRAAVKQMIELDRMRNLEARIKMYKAQIDFEAPKLLDLARGFL